jgi:hypothetical protein
MTNLFTRWLEPMRRPEPTRRCPTIPADDPVLAIFARRPLMELAPEPETVRVDLATFRRIRLEMRG